MRFDLISLFPEMLMEALKASILERAQKSGLIECKAHSLRQFGIGKHLSVDDTPYGGGAGMLLRVDVMDAALQSVTQSVEQPYKILLTPQGQPFTQAMARQLAKRPQLTLICGHYEGFDERIRDLVDLEVSIGPYVLTGGEFPALVMVDAISRLVPGVISQDSPEEESFSIQTADGQLLLEYPQYTKPALFAGKSVPDILLSGHHAEITKWRMAAAQQKTNSRNSRVNTEEI